MRHDEAWITVECPVCHRIELKPEQITVYEYPSGATYAFTCGCGRRVVRDASPKIVGMLVDVGVEKVAIVLPERKPLDLPPIDPEEILTLHEALQRPDVLDELA